MDQSPHRVENRTAARISVDLASLDARAPAREAITENISIHGARVVTSRAFQLNERVNVRSLLGNLRSRARVVYCIPISGGMFAVGLQLLATAGDWRLPHKAI